MDKDYLVPTEIGLYDMRDTIEAELNNNLLMVNSYVKELNLPAKPDFYIAGGAALVFHGLNPMATMDIDMVNRMSEKVKEAVGKYIDDAASEVTVLASNYRERAIKLRDDLEYVDIFILAKEDLLLTKLISGRRKDYEHMIQCDLLSKDTVTKASYIIEHEFVPLVRDTLKERLQKVCEKYKS